MKMEAIKSKTGEGKVNPSKVVSRDEWLIARKDLLTRDREVTRLRDAFSKQRRESIGTEPTNQGKD
jgi:predicted dithiol-disulfide oxidoreductase (DUF899 family)